MLFAKVHPFRKGLYTLSALAFAAQFAGCACGGLSTVDQSAATCADCSSTVASAIALDISEPRQVHAGEQFEYHVVATNISDHPVDQVTIFKRRPQSATTASATGQRQQASTNGLTASRGAREVASRDLGRLNPGESKAITFRDVGRSEGPMRRCLTVEYQPAWCATVEVVQPRLAIAQQLTQDGGYLCDELAVHYRISNPGSGTTAPVSLRVNLPEGLAPAGGARFSEMQLGPIAAGKSIDKQMVLTPSRAGDFQIYAVAQTPDLQVESDRTTLHVVQPQLDLNVDGPQQAFVGRQVEYTVSVKNTGSARAEDAAVKIDLPADAEHVMATNHTYDSRNGVARIGSLEPGETYRFTVSFDAADKGDVQARFAADAYCAEEQTAALATSILGIPAVRLEMVDITDPVTVGQTTAYEVRVKNQGSEEDLGISLTGELPESLEFVSGSGATSVTADGDTVNFGRLEQLAPGQTAIWRVRVRGEEAGKSRFAVQLSTNSTRRPITEQEPTTIVAAAKP